jgi:hypothetical protein
VWLDPLSAGFESEFDPPLRFEADDWPSSSTEVPALSPKLCLPKRAPKQQRTQSDAMCHDVAVGPNWSAIEGINHLSCLLMHFYSAIHAADLVFSWRSLVTAVPQHSNQQSTKLRTSSLLFACSLTVCSSRPHTTRQVICTRRRDAAVFVSFGKPSCWRKALKKARRTRLRHVHIGTHPELTLEPRGVTLSQIEHVLPHNVDPRGSRRYRRPQQTVLSQPFNSDCLGRGLCRLACLGTALWRHKSLPLEVESRWAPLRRSCSNQWWSLVRSSQLVDRVRRGRCCTNCRRL